MAVSLPSWYWCVGESSSFEVVLIEATLASPVPLSHLALYHHQTLKELVFSVNETLPQQIEATVLNITGALFGISLSTAARFLSSLRPDDSPSARAIPAIFLVLAAFIGTLRFLGPVR
jgi:hypothetical protein